jgi:hypothetical protein
MKLELDNVFEGGLTLTVGLAGMILMAAVLVGAW